MSTIRIESKLDHATLKKPLPWRAFKPGGIFRVEFPAGMSLYKVTQAGAVTGSGALPAGAAGFVTPWWFSYKTLAAQHPRLGTVNVRGIADVVESANRSKAGSLLSFLRARGAVCRDWNTMTHLLIVELRRSAIGMIGACSGQPVFDDVGVAQASGVDNIRFIGGEQQLYMPGLRVGDVVVRSFGSLP